MGEDKVIINLNRREWFWIYGPGYYNIITMLLDVSREGRWLVEESIRRGLRVLPSIIGRWHGDRIAIVGDYDRVFEGYSSYLNRKLEVDIAIVEARLLWEFYRTDVKLCDIFKHLIELGLLRLPPYHNEKCVEWVTNICDITAICIATDTSDPDDRFALTDNLLSLSSRFFP